MFLTFNNGEKMPAFGIGTWQVSDAVALDENILLKSKLFFYFKFKTGKKNT